MGRDVSADDITDLNELQEKLKIATYQILEGQDSAIALTAFIENTFQFIYYQCENRKQLEGAMKTILLYVNDYLENAKFDE